MIKRANLSLCEISRKEYISMMKRLHKRRKDNEYSEFSCFAKITEKLIYENWKELLRNFKETPMAKCASVMIMQKEWEKFYFDGLDEETISYLDNLATDRGFLYLSFYTKIEYGFRVNNEIGFELVNKVSPMVESRSIVIPGEERIFYDWNGSSNTYRRIRGIYTPIAHNRQEESVLQGRHA